jgi:hypothetical protein
MEKIAGAAIFLVGVLIMFSGRPAATENASPKEDSFRLPAWADKAIQWGIGILSVWFGVQLFFGKAHFF